MSHPARPATGAILAGILLSLLCGCNHALVPRSVVTVVSANQNQPLQSDVLKQPTDSTTAVADDAITVELQNRPADSELSLTPGGPFGTVFLDTYQVTFQSDEAIPSVSGALGWTVDTGSTVTGEIVIVPAVLKTEPPLVGLDQQGEIQAVAHIVITGHEANSQKPIHVETDLQVNFANWIDPS